MLASRGTSVRISCFLHHSFPNHYGETMCRSKLPGIKPLPTVCRQEICESNDEDCQCYVYHSITSRDSDLTSQSRCNRRRPALSPRTRCPAYRTFASSSLRYLEASSKHAVSPGSQQRVLELSSAWGTCSSGGQLSVYAHSVMRTHSGSHLRAVSPDEDFSGRLFQGHMSWWKDLQAPKRGVAAIAQWTIGATLH